MIWESASAFWAMGGYGLYVWGSFSMTALVMIGEAWWAKHAQRQAIRQLQTTAALDAAATNEWA